jgi:predicted nucleic acid-binding protein
MRRFLIDTTLLTAYLLNRQFALQLIKPWIKKREVVTSILVYGEVHEYILGRSDYSKLQTRLVDLIEEIRPIYLTYQIMERYGVIRRLLRPKRSLIGDIDTIIAASALERNLTLVTSDTDFKRVPELKLMLIPRSKLARHSSKSKAKKKGINGRI